MLTDEKPEVYLKRRMLARDYFMHVPEERVLLNKFTQGPDLLLFRTAIGFDALKCNAVACLAGWLWTLPEYREWAESKGLPICDVASTSLWIGVGRCFGDHNAFDPRGTKEGSGSDKGIAMRRLDALVREAEEAVRVNPGS